MTREHKRRRSVLAAAGLALLSAAAAAQAPSQPSSTAARFDAGTISGLPARNIGSAMMSGRVAAVTASDDNGRLTVIIGSASGGVWKSVDVGTTVKPVFGQQNVQS